MPITARKVRLRIVHNARVATECRPIGELLLRDAMADLRRLQARYNRVSELAPVWKALKRIRPRPLGVD